MAPGPAATAGGGIDWGRAGGLIGFWPVLTPGSKDGNVVAAQYLLRQHGKTVTADGQFSEGTRSAVESFQRERGLPADGRIGPETWQALVGGVILGPGDRDVAVRALQELLRDRYSATLAVSGLFDGPTGQAVRAFQAEVCLEHADGVAVPETWYALINRSDFCTGNPGADAPATGDGGETPARGGPPAAQILLLHQQGKLVLDGGGTSCDPLSNVQNAARGQPALCGPGRDREQLLGEGMLRGMVAMVGRVGSYTVTCLCDGGHSPNSFHYVGSAVDIGEVAGTVIQGASQAAARFMAGCVALGAAEVLGPSDGVPGAARRADHEDHIHCGDW